MKTSKEWQNLNDLQKYTILEHQNELPVKLGLISKEFGLVVKVTTLNANISGQIKEENGRIEIKINKHDVKARQRYTLAHEIAHFLLHRDLLSNGITDDVLYRSDQSSEIEAEANRLAADILMPMNRVTELIKKHSSDKKDDRLYEAIAQEMGISSVALKIRLNKV